VATIGGCGERKFTLKENGRTGCPLACWSCCVRTICCSALTADFPVMPDVVSALGSESRPYDQLIASLLNPGTFFRLEPVFNLNLGSMRIGEYGLLHHKSKKGADICKVRKGLALSNYCLGTI